MTRPSRFAHLAVTFILACSGPSAPDAGSDAAISDAASSPDGGSCPAFVPFETGDDGHLEPLGATAGQVRAGRLTAAQLPADATGLGVWAAGDYVIASDRIALMIEAPGASDLYDPYGGRPVGVARVQGGALVDAGDFNEVLFGFAGFLVATETVSVLNDGADGNAAVIRVTGPLASIAFAGDLIASLAPGDYTDLPAALDYTLEPGSDEVQVSLTVAQTGPTTVRAPFVLLGFFQHYRMPFWAPGDGFEAPSGSLHIGAFIDDRAASYAWIAPEGQDLSLLIEVSGVAIFSLDRATIGPCTQETIPLGSMLIGGNGLVGLERALAARQSTSLRTITGTVRENDGSTPAEGSVRIHVTRADGSHWARLWPAADGTFSLDVPNEDVHFYAFRQGLPLVGPIDASPTTNDVSVDLGPQAILHVTVTDADSSEAIPARVQVLPTLAVPSVPDAFGERPVGTGRAHVAFATSGSVDLPVAPGEHTVIASRGYENELAPLTITVIAGETRDVALSIDHSVDTTGVMCADYHIHTQRSPDSDDGGDLKIAGLVADGLELPIRSDHEWINDFQPRLVELGLDRFAHGIGGEELTTFAWGHFGVFPLVEDRSLPSGSAVPWVGHLPPAVFDVARARPEHPALIINHPRSGGTLGGYFTAAAFDPTTGNVGEPQMWDETFSIVEVFNDSDFERNRDGTVRDWLSLLSSGRRIVAVGSSDSHHIYTSPVGYPRTCLQLGSDDPRAVTPNDVRDATEAGHAVVSGGIYLNVVGPGSTGPGDDAAGAGSTASFDVTVRAATWIDVDSLEVIVDGATQQTIPITATDTDPLDGTIRLHASIDVPVATGGSYVIFHASGEEDLAPLHPGRRPFAVSNPIYLTR